MMLFPAREHELPVPLWQPAPRWTEQNAGHRIMSPVVELNASTGAVHMHIAPAALASGEPSFMQFHAAVLLPPPAE